MQLRRPESSPRSRANEAPQDNQRTLSAPSRADDFELPLGAVKRAVSSDRPDDVRERTVLPLQRAAGGDRDTLAGHVNNARQILELALETIDPTDPHAASKYLAAIGSASMRLRHAAELLERTVSK
jgi:hypothetical protein